MASKISVQLTLRIDQADYERFKAAAQACGLSVPMWLIRCGLTAVETGL